MRVLVVTATPPWPSAHGAALRNSLFLEVLAAEHQVDVIFLDQTDGIETSVPDSICQFVRVRASVPSVIRRLQTGFSQGLPDVIARHSSWTLRGRVQMLLARDRYDVVHLAQIQLAPLIHDVHTMVTRDVDRPRVSYDAHNVERLLQAALADVSTGLRSFWAGRQARLIRRVEEWIARTVDLSVGSSENDCSRLGDLGAKSPVYIPHPVRVPSRCPGIDGRNANPTVLFAANFGYRPNILAAEWFFGRVWPGIVRNLPRAELRVIGPGSKALGPIVPARTTLGGIVGDIEGEYRRAWIAVSPTSVAAGAPYKVLSAFAAGRPVVARTEGYVGLAPAEQIGVATASHPDDFARVTTAILIDDSAYKSAKAAGFSYLQAVHNADVVGSQLLKAYARIVESGSNERRR